MAQIFLSSQDSEDYEQEKAIKAWIECEGISDFEFTSINSKGNIKHVGDFGAFSLNEVVKGSDGESTYADIIASNEVEEEEDENILSIDGCYEALLIPLGLNIEVTKWVTKLCSKVKTKSKLGRRIAGTTLNSFKRNLISRER